MSNRSAATLTFYLKRLISRDGSSSRTTASSVIALALSIVGIVISVVTFYITRIREPKLSVVAGTRLFAWYPHSRGPALEFSWPVAFANPSERGGHIVRCAMMFSLVGAPSRRYVPWSYFQKDENKILTHVALAHPFTVPARSTEARIISFWWSEPGDRGSYVFSKGEYELTLLAWTAETVKPQIAKSYRVTVSPRLADEIARLHRDRPTENFEFRLGTALHDPVILSRSGADRLLQP